MFVFSDHGEWCGDYIGRKMAERMRRRLDARTLIARVPGVTKAGHVSTEIVELYDIMATCLDLAGISPQHTHFARSLVPQLRGQRGDPDRAALCEGG